MQNLNIPKDELEEILGFIRSADNPTGIDAAKTHAVILYKLMQIDRRIEALEMKFFEEEE